MTFAADPSRGDTSPGAPSAPQPPTRAESWQRQLQPHRDGERQNGGRFVRVHATNPDGYRVKVYADYSRHDVEKRRPAPLTR